MPYHINLSSRASVCVETLLFAVLCGYRQGKARHGACIQDLSFEIHLCKQLCTRFTVPLIMIVCFIVIHELMPSLVCTLFASSVSLCIILRLI